MSESALDQDMYMTDQQGRTSRRCLVLQSRRRRRDLIAHEAQDSWQHLQLYLQGCQLFADEEGTSTALQRHLVRTTATSLLDWLLHYQVWPAAQPLLYLSDPRLTL